MSSTTKQLLIALLLLLAYTGTRAQGIPVTGTIRNEQGQPLPSVSVLVSGSGKGTMTDEHGRFTLQVSPHALLLVTSVGFDTLSVRAQANLDLVLRRTNGFLNDVIVVGYGTQKRKDLNGAISTVSAKDFQQGAITTPEQLIAGKVAGVSVTSNGGSPGAGSVIRIRGGASLNASNDPLIVIDGVPLSGNNIYGASNSLSLINPDDIESFTVLKDAAATAIYGSRASNGVILITTKRGGHGRPRWSFSTELSVNTLAKDAKVLSPAQFRAYVDSLGTGTYDGTHTYASLLGTANTDWQKQIYHTALATDNNLSLTGALKNMPYRISGGYLNQDGILKTDNLQRITAGISLSPRLLHNRLKIDLNLKGTENITRFANQAAISSAVYFDPTQPVHATSPYGNYFEWASTDPNTGAVTLNKLAPRNPVALLDLYHNQSTVYRSFGNIQADYSFPFLPELHANLNLGYDVASGKGTIRVPAYAAQNFLDSGQNNVYSNRIDNTVEEFYLSYDKALRSIRGHVTVTAGTGYYDNLSINYNYYDYRANGDSIPGTTPLPTDKPETRLLSYYGRLVYTYNDRYTLAASLRTDGSSRFGPQTRWGVFPSLALTWKLNQENFLQRWKALSDLKLRLSYGVTGNQDGIYPYPYLAVYSPSNSSSLVQFGDSYYTMASPAAYDANIKWEQTATYNAGLDYGFFSNRISGSVDVYYKKTKDLLNTIPIPAGTNFSSTLLTNVGNVENKGVEWDIHAIPVQRKNMEWDLGFNLAYNTNKITNLTATKDPTYPGTLTGNGLVQINSVGYSANAFYVYHQIYDASGHPIEGVYKDVNGDGIINQQDLYHYKSPFPKFILGFSTQVTWKRWTASTVLRANFGNYVYNGVATNAIQANILNPLGYLANSLSDVLYTHFYYSNPQSDYYVQNASFLKMDNIGLSYNVGNILGKTASLRLSANCQNVFTVTKYTGLDPEIYGGIDNTLYPRPRVFTLGAHLNF